MARNEWMTLVQEALRDPQANARRILGWPLPGQVVWQAVLLVSVLAVMGLYGTLMLAGGAAVMGGGAAGASPFPSPFAMVALQLLAMALLAGVMAGVGRLFGGTGDFAGALRLMAWLQALMVLLQIVQLVAVLVLPPMAGLISLASLAALGWVATGFVTALHGFKSQGLVFLGILGSLLGLGFVMSLLLLPFVPVPQ